ncbi:MAG: hypothetical protein PHW76_01455 [Alphaproteobacteria bacterium]|nr:hypothetical protein [Alphaproteobacteria bacterium]
MDTLSNYLSSTNDLCARFKNTVKQVCTPKRMKQAFVFFSALSIISASAGAVLHQDHFAEDTTVFKGKEMKASFGGIVTYWNGAAEDLEALGNALKDPLPVASAASENPHIVFRDNGKDYKLYYFINDDGQFIARGHLKEHNYTKVNGTEVGWEDSDDDDHIDYFLDKETGKLYKQNTVTEQRYVWDEDDRKWNITSKTTQDDEDNENYVDSEHKRVISKEAVIIGRVTWSDNVTVEKGAEIKSGGDLKIGPDVYIGENVSVEGNGTITRSSLIGDEATGENEVVTYEYKSTGEYHEVGGSPKATSIHGPFDISDCEIGKSSELYNVTLNGFTILPKTQIGSEKGEPVRMIDGEIGESSIIKGGVEARTLYIGREACIEQDATIQDFSGGEEITVGRNSTIQNVFMGTKGVVGEGSTVEGSTVFYGATVGPNATLKRVTAGDYLTVGDNVSAADIEAGDRVTIKNDAVVSKGVLGTNSTVAAGVNAADFQLGDNEILTPKENLAEKDWLPVRVVKSVGSKLWELVT